MRKIDENLGKGAEMRTFCGVLFLLLLSQIAAYSQLLQQQSNTVVFLQEKEQQLVTRNDGSRIPQQITKFGTGFLVADDNPLTLFLVTAQHVAEDMKSERTVTIRGEGDTPINMPLEDLVGDKNIKWTFHDVGSGNSEPLIPDILSRSALAGEASSKFR